MSCGQCTRTYSHYVYHIYIYIYKLLKSLTIFMMKCTSHFHCTTTTCKEKKSIEKEWEKKINDMERKRAQCDTRQIAMRAISHPEGGISRLFVCLFVCLFLWPSRNSRGSPPLTFESRPTRRERRNRTVTRPR